MKKSLAGLSLRDLEYVEAVAEFHHFGRAAESCHVSQPALSEQVRKLEALLGMRIFERSKRHVALTTQGTVLLVQIKRILTEARNLIAISHEGAELSGVLHLGAIETLGPYYLYDVLKLLRTEKPDISLRLTENRTAVLVERLRHGALDLVLAVATSDMPGLSHAPLFFEPFILAMPCQHPLSNLPQIKLDNLPVEDLLLLQDGHCLRDHALALCSGAPAATRHTTSLETLWQMIAAGEGYSLLPALAIAARPDLANLISCRKLDQHNAGRMISLIWRASDPREAQFRALAGLMRSHAPAGVTPC